MNHLMQVELWRPIFPRAIVDTVASFIDNLFMDLP
jgi:hypothetical protein